MAQPARRAYAAAGRLSREAGGIGQARDGAGATAAITVDAGLDPPSGGGFEVRRHDGAFGTGAASSAGGDLVLRSPVRGFTLPRAAFEEHFFVRMYDAATPPHYSRQSAAIVTHLPLG